MMRSECCDCDRTAIRYWGRYAYCRKCLNKAVAEKPRDHECPKCKQEQPPQVMWRGTACGGCK